MMTKAMTTTTVMMTTLMMLSCGGYHTHKVEGGTDNKIEISESFCDPETFPNKLERKLCKNRILKVLARRCGEKDDGK